MPDVAHSLPDERYLVSCGTARACWYQSRPLSSLVDASQRSPAPEPRSRDPGLAALGLAEEAIRRAWAALAYGTWQATQLLESWEQLIREDRHAPTSMGAIVLWPVTSSACRGAGLRDQALLSAEALPAISLDAAHVGTVGTQRLAVLCLLVRGESTDTSETDLQMRLLQQANEQLADDEALVCDRGFPSDSSRWRGFNAMSSVLL